jgi:hypothetical protein
MPDSAQRITPDNPQSYTPEGATDQKRKHDLVALAFQATPNSAGVGSEVVRNAVKRVFCCVP